MRPATAVQCLAAEASRLIELLLPHDPAVADPCCGDACPFCHWSLPALQRAVAVERAVAVPFIAVCTTVWTHRPTKYAIFPRPAQPPPPRPRLKRIRARRLCRTKALEFRQGGLASVAEVDTDGPCGLLD